MIWPIALGIMFAILAFVELGRTVLCFYQGYKYNNCTHKEQSACLMINTVVLSLAALIILWVAY
ncbi:MAG: hypothetical protein IJZ68_08355 [Bacteroidaceae bacterium]|nr:hypothetical protein [Bacteroidaceae bacterium]